MGGGADVVPSGGDGRDGLFGQRLAGLSTDESGPDTRSCGCRWSPHSEYIRGDDLCDALLKGWGSDRADARISEPRQRVVDVPEPAV